MDNGKDAGLGLAPSEEQVWRSRYRTFVRLYRGRDDRIAERTDGEYSPLPGAGLTFERFLDHARMLKTYALYNMDDAGRVSFGLFDVDILPRNQGWEKLLLSMDQKKRETVRIMQTLTELGLDPCHMLVEFPTVGFHLLIFFDRPVGAKALKALMRFVLGKSSLDRVPFYPKKVEGAAWGDCVQLPLRMNLNTGRRSNFVRDLETFDPENYPTEPDWGALEGIVPIDSEWVQRMVDQHGLHLQ